MGVEENIAFILSQRKLYEAMQHSGEQQISELEERFRAYSLEVSRAREQIRSVEATLASPRDAPSEAAIRERMLLEAAVETYSSLELIVVESEDRLLEVANQYLSIKKEIEEYPKGELSNEDKLKMSRVSETLRSQLFTYGFKSYPPAEVSVSADHFRPIVEVETDIGKLEAELSFEMSASDAIRLKWAYLLSFLKLGQEMTTNHPGFLVFDEPGQQEVDPVSFGALVQWVASACSEGQVIFATSEAPEAWEGALVGHKVNILRREGYILKRLD
jgi:hypothetical protein